MLQPTANAPVRGRLDQWFERAGVRPRVAGEFDDSALLKTFVVSGLGVFPPIALVHDDLIGRYGLWRIGACEGVDEHFYAIGTEKKVRQPPAERLLPRQSRAL